MITLGTSCSRPHGSHTDVAGSLPIRTVPATCREIGTGSNGPGEVCCTAHSAPARRRHSSSFAP